MKNDTWSQSQAVENRFERGNYYVTFLQDSQLLMARASMQDSMGLKNDDQI